MHIFDRTVPSVDVISALGDVPINPFDTFLVILRERTRTPQSSSSVTCIMTASKGVVFFMTHRIGLLGSNDGVMMQQCKLSGNSSPDVFSILFQSIEWIICV